MIKKTTTQQGDTTMRDMRQVMTAAWTIRKAAAAKYGVKVSDVSMSACLKLAWAQPMEETKEAKQLRKQRRILADADYNTYSPNDFPGSKRWTEHQKAEKALAEFDAKHPEVRAALQAKKDAKASKRLNSDIWND